MSANLPRIEWEFFQDDQIVDAVTEPDSLKDCVEQILVQRDEEYDLIAQVTGQRGKRINPPVDDEPAGSLVTALAITGTSQYGLVTYEIDQCYMSSVSNKDIQTGADTHGKQTTAQIRCYRVGVKISLSIETERAWLTEW